MSISEDKSLVLCLLTEERKKVKAILDEYYQQIGNGSCPNSFVISRPITKVKIEQSLYRPGQALRIAEG